MAIAAGAAAAAEAAAAAAAAAAVVVVVVVVDVVVVVVVVGEVLVMLRCYFCPILFRPRYGCYEKPFRPGGRLGGPSRRPHLESSSQPSTNYHLPHQAACHRCPQPTTTRSDNFHINASYFIPTAFRGERLKGTSAEQGFKHPV